MDFVQLTVCWNALEAGLVKGRLETAGIPCVLQGGNISSVEIGNGGISSAFAIPVLVRAEDLDSARGLLDTKAN
ncbi:MAG: DUF2007 domain-containing protein [Bacteroidales bacterium]|nr:DUF2007 domain-containing protein [Bacteroidales bacterium]